MSGIVGCIGNGDIPGLLLQGLARLEYLGYDSAGLAILQDGKLVYEKLTGALRLLTARVNHTGFRGPTGIAGLRFATQGEPSRANAPPQLGCNADVAVVHTGLIENFGDVKKHLLADGHRFRSQTDTEVLAHLVEGRLTGSGFLEVFLEILGLLEGGFSFLVIDSSRPEEILGACAETPLWVCSGNGFTIASSELAPLIAHSTQAVRIEPGSVVRVRRDGVEVFGKDGKRREVETREIGWTLAQAQRGGHRFFTEKEIEEQPVAIRRAFSYRIGDRGVRLRNFGLTRRSLRDCDLIRAVGSGSSFHAAQVAKKYIEELVRIPAAALPASELISGDPVVSDKSLLVAFSQSGKTSDTLRAVRMWKKRGGRVLVLSNTPGSPLWNEGDGTLGTHAGPEIGLVSTKTYTSSLVTAYLFAVTLGVARGAIKSVPERELIYGLQRLPESVEAVLAKRDEIAALADHFVSATSSFITGFGLHFATAQEGALKMKQLASLHTEGVPVGEIRHQILNMVGPERPVVALALNKHGYDATLDAVREIKNAGGTVLAIVSEGDGAVAELADGAVKIPPVAGLLAPVLSTVALQMLAVSVAGKRGLDLDKPSNLRRYFE